MRETLLRGATLADEDAERTLDLLLKDGKIAQTGQNLSPPDGADVLDLSGKFILPPLFDMHVHFRDPGFPQKETLRTGMAAALAGGVGEVLCMPNTNPPMDSPERLRDLLCRARAVDAGIHQAGCLTVGLRGEVLAPYEELKEAGALALSDDGRPIPTKELMTKALLAAKAAGLPVLSHCEDLAIIDGGIINKGEISERLGVRGMDRRSEESVTARDCRCALQTGARLHICHVSTRGSVQIVREAKAAGGDITCETAPHYFSLTEEKLLTRDADYRMNPPLRTRDDLEAVREGILDGTIDCIATDHAPHTAAEKADFLTAPNGVVGLETSLSAALTSLYHTGALRMRDIARLMVYAPRKILGLALPRLERGAAAEFIVVDPELSWEVVPEKLRSKSKNTAFKGMTLRGKATMFFHHGEMLEI